MSALLHPAEILVQEALRLCRPEVHRGTITYPPEWAAAAKMLRDYEAEHGVTFTPLGNASLAHVRALRGHLRAAREQGRDFSDQVRIGRALADALDTLLGG